jgi:outer membrane protein assembly factor BamB
MVYVGSADNNVYALDASTGAKLWSYTTGFFVESSPAVANGVVYVGSDYPDSKVCALNARTGVRLWAYTASSGVYSSPAVANGVVYVGSDLGRVYAFGLTRGGAKRDWANPGAASERCDLKTLHPDRNLKGSAERNAVRP